MAAGRVYTAEFHAIAVTAQQDLFYVKPAADKPIQIEWATITQVTGTTDAGDAKEDDWRIELIYLPATVTASAGGSSFTPTPLDVNDAAAGFTARINDTTKATTSGTAVNVHSDGMNNRIGFVYLPAPEHRPRVANAAAMVLRLNTTPNASNTLNGTIYVREF